MNYLSCEEVARKMGITVRRIQQMCKQGEIAGAVKDGRNWRIPENAVFPGSAEKKKPLPVGVSDFKSAATDYYYVDKTLLIRDFLDTRPMVSLFTRPRRFGKTLNIDMLRVFFEKTQENTSCYFKDKKIWKCGEAYTRHQGQYPVIFLTFKDVKCFTWEETFQKICKLISLEFIRHVELEESSRLSVYEKEQYRRIAGGNADDLDYQMGLQFLSLLLHKHYGKACVIIIDEYDIPIQQGENYGFYSDAVHFIRNFFSGGLKDNPHLNFGFLTGVLQVAKESIFSDMNNLKISSVLDENGSEYFGFTSDEVKSILTYYGKGDKFREICEWYGGYHFGAADIFCPWDVINHVDRLCSEPEAKPSSYWINTSGNELVKCFIDKANKTTRDEIEQLLDGRAVEKSVRLDLTYDEIDNNIENLWSVLFMTGYLTQTGSTKQGAYQLVIPNKEVMEVYRLQIQEWFREQVFGNTEQLADFWKSLEEGKTDEIEKYLTRTLGNSISVFDTKAPEHEKENSYHTFLVGLLVGNSDWLVKSNVEAGDGFADIIVETEDPDAGIIIELKYSKEIAGMEKACEKAIAQIKERRYDDYLRNDGRQEILIYGMAFCRKKCRITAEKMPRIRS